MMIELKPFLNMLRRATHCGFPTVIMNNRMLMQCYNLDIDSDVGLHYIMHIPDDYDPLTDFYDRTMVLNPREILKAYGTGHKELDTIRKEKKMMPKSTTEQLEFHEHKHHLDLEFHFYLAGEEITTTTVTVISPFDVNSPEIENCTKTYDTLMSRIKRGGACLAFDGLRLGLQPRIVECPEVYRYQVKYGGKRVSVPFTKSMFLGIKDPDKFLFSIQETLMDDIYVLSISLEKKGLTEQFWGYVVQYQ